MGNPRGGLNTYIHTYIQANIQTYTHTSIHTSIHADMQTFLFIRRLTCQTFVSRQCFFFTTTTYINQGINYIKRLNIAFVRYHNRLNAEFARVAMADQVQISIFYCNLCFSLFCLSSFFSECCVVACVFYFRCLFVCLFVCMSACLFVCFFLSFNSSCQAPFS